MRWPLWPGIFPHVNIMYVLVPRTIRPALVIPLFGSNEKKIV